jgi:hypothetical protein
MGIGFCFRVDSGMCVFLYPVQRSKMRLRGHQRVPMTLPHVARLFRTRFNGDAQVGYGRGLRGGGEEMHVGRMT